MLGDKLNEKWSEVVISKVPQYRGLKVKNLLRFAESKLNITKFLPEYFNNKEPNEDWLWNLINILIPKEFKLFVDQSIDTRNKEFIDTQNLQVNAKDEFIEIFKLSKSIFYNERKILIFCKVAKKTKQQQKLKALKEEKIRADVKIKNLKECLREFNEKVNNLELQQRE